MLTNFISHAQINHFKEYGYLKLENCLDLSLADYLIEKAYRRLGVNPGNPNTWARPLIHTPSENYFPMKESAPKIWGAICDLLGGADRIKEPYHLKDNFIINFSLERECQWLPPSAESKGWHKDGDFFWHYLDSPEQALLPIILWKDIEHRGGGTYLALDSVKHVAKHLLEHPEGLHPFEGGFEKLVSKCSNFMELTGKAGDVFLLHPFMLHASSQNHLHRPRIITNPVVSLKEPLCFKREKAEDYSTLEESILKSLGVKSLEFAISRPRRAFDHSAYNYLEQYWPEEYSKLKV